MKQRITKKQLNELSEKSFLELEKWKVDKGYGCFPYREKGKWRGDTLSIGQMIEFLDDSGDVIEFDQEYKWNVEADKLCDALFEAVKEVLER